MRTLFTHSITKLTFSFSVWISNFAWVIEVMILCFQGKLHHIVFGEVNLGKTCVFLQFLEWRIDSCRCTPFTQTLVSCFHLHESIHFRFLRSWWSAVFNNPHKESALIQRENKFANLFKAKRKYLQSSFN